MQGIIAAEEGCQEYRFIHPCLVQHMEDIIRFFVTGTMNVGIDYHGQPGISGSSCFILTRYVSFFSVAANKTGISGGRNSPFCFSHFPAPWCDWIHCEILMAAALDVYGRRFLRRASDMCGSAPTLPRCNDDSVFQGRLLCDNVHLRQGKLREVGFVLLNRMDL
jgi:hypothetical protein